MTLPPQLILRPGELLTGRRLRELFRYRDPIPTPTGPVPVWARMNSVQSTSGRSIAHVGRQIIPRTIQWMRVEASIALVPERRWAYTLQPGGPDVSGLAFMPSSDPAVTGLNTVELNNFAGSDIVGYGVDVSDTPDAMVTLLPIRNDSIVPTVKLTDPDGSTVYWFTADNPPNVVCLR